MICNKPKTPSDAFSRANLSLSGYYVPSAAICSLVLTGWNPTNGTCMLARVPMAYHEEYATYRRLLKRPMRISASEWSRIIFVMNA